MTKLTRKNLGEEYWKIRILKLLASHGSRLEEGEWIEGLEWKVGVVELQWSPTLRLDNTVTSLVRPVFFGPKNRPYEKNPLMRSPVNTANGHIQYPKQ